MFACMKKTLIMTILGTDRSGLVRSIAAAVAAHGASWQESRMARMAGQFAGILRVDCPSENVATLSSTLEGLACEGINIPLITEPTPEQDYRRGWPNYLLANTLACMFA